MSRKPEQTQSGSRVSFKKQLVRNPVKNNSNATVIKENVPVEPLNLKDIESAERTSSRALPSLKKTTFSLPDIDASLKTLSLNTKSKFSSRTNSSDKESKKSQYTDKSTKLDVPGVNSSLQLSKRIDNLGKVRTSSFKGSSGKRAYDEKVTRQVNFPYEKKIFKDLMPLSSPNKHIQSVLTSREPLPPKDKEPILDDFIEPIIIPEYSYIPNFKLETRKSRAHLNNLRLYKVLRFLEKC